jgi:hypothetical protein
MEDFKKLPKMQSFKTGGKVPQKFVKAMEKQFPKGATITPAEDTAQDKAMVKKGVAQHESALHEGEPKTELKLKTGGRAKKAVGTVKKYKTGGEVTNVYEAKKSAGDKDNIKKVKDQTPVKLCGGKSVKKYAAGSSVDNDSTATPVLAAAPKAPQGSGYDSDPFVKLRKKIFGA